MLNVQNTTSNAKWEVHIPHDHEAYWILVLDDDYQYTLVGVPSKLFAFILARNPIINETIYENLTSYACSLGFGSTSVKPHQGDDCDYNDTIVDFESGGIVIESVMEW